MQLEKISSSNGDKNKKAINLEPCFDKIVIIVNDNIIKKNIKYLFFELYIIFFP